jgi:hypothetical protein
LTPAQVTGPAPATVARMSNAQSGSLKEIGPRAPAEGAAPSGFQSLVPARRIDSSDIAEPVPLTRVKLDAPASSGVGETARASAARLGRTLFMAPDIHPSRQR